MKRFVTPRIAVRWAEFSLILLVAGIAAYAQTGGVAISTTAAEFEKEVAQTLEASGADPGVCRGVIERLKADRQVMDRTILRCVEAHINADDRRQSTRSASSPNRYASSRQFIREIIGLVPDRDLLRAHLLSRDASLAVATGDFPRASEAYQAALKTVQPVRLDADLQWMTSLVNLGQSLLSQNQNKEAESYFLQALSYEWYTIVGYPNQMRMLRDQYIQAGRGLIASRRGNLQALQEIIFVPATEQELGPVLQQAIQEAKASK